MSVTVLDQLTNKIDSIIEMVEMLRMQVEDLEERNAALETENNTLKNRQSQWEQGVTQILHKLENVEGEPEARKMENFEREKIEGLV